MSAVLKIEDNHLQFKPDFDKDTITQLKFLGMRWAPAKKHWYAKITKIFVGNFLSIFPEFIWDLRGYAPIISPNSQWTPSSYLMDHQKSMAETALTIPRYLIYHDIGVGKTIIGIELVKQKQAKTLVTCPLSIIEDAWMEDIKKFAPEINAVNLWKAKKNRQLNFALTLDFHVAIINFESFRTEAKQLAQAGFQMLIIDESSKCRDARSQITKALIEFSENMDYIYELSGNPAPNSEMEYFSQARMVDPMLFGRSFFAFRNKYFYSFGYGNFQWKMKEDKRKEFLDKLASISEVVRREDVLDLPGKTLNIRKVFLTTIERKVYETMKRDLVIEFAGMEVVAANAAVKQMKLREGTSGFYLDENKKAVIVGQSKLNELKELLEEIGDHQVAIWTHFHYEADIVEKLLGKKCGRVDGTIKNQDVKHSIVRDWKDGKLQYLIAHPDSFGHGHTWINCFYIIYFSLSHSWDLFYQSMGRFERKGQTNKCTYYFLIADCSVDEVIWVALQAKKSVSQAVFDYIKGKKK
ncbi:MAG TPA: hypothetical protein ENI23_03440 [bacterium]|nr:hypothetical protein [bacterium]